MKQLFTAIALVFTLVSLSSAQSSRALEEIIKSDIRSAKQRVVGLNIHFSDSTKNREFWEIYEEYQNKLKMESDAYIDLLKKYADNYSNMSDEVANEIAKESFRISKAKTKLLEKAYKRVAKLSPIEATRFVQLERRIDLLLQMEIAESLPLLLPNGVTVGEGESVIEVTVE
jgi:hypothetical protein